MTLPNANENLKVLMVVGTRPEILKMLPVKFELDRQGIDNKFISTGQQRDLTHQTFEDLKFFPDQDLALMQDNQSSASFLSLAIVSITQVLAEYQPTYTLVQGDTGTALAAALAAYNSKIRIGHIEAGLRSHNLYAPWPEEGFRRLIDSISNILWYPTKNNVQNLEKDQIGIVTGNTIVDTLVTFKPAENMQKTKKILVTLHRRESFNNTLDEALVNIIELAENSNYEIEFIQHPNPHIALAMDRTEFRKSKVKISSPLPYLEFIQRLAASSFVITDSGGLQEEARSLGVPLLVLRENTERMEAIDGKFSRLSQSNGSSLKSDIQEIEQILKDETYDTSNNPFGDGNASKKIVQSIVEDFETQKC